MRSQEKSDKLIRQFNENPNLSLEIVSDIFQLNAFDDVVNKHSSDTDFVIHMTSPVKYEVNDFNNEVLIPAVNGTKIILKAIKKYPPHTVRHVV